MEKETYYGNFDFIKDSNSREMIEDMYNAVMNTSNGYDYIKNFKKADHFMFNNNNILNEIGNKLKYTGHSGFSHAWTLRQVEFIIKNGFEDYKNKCKF